MTNRVLLSAAGSRKTGTIIDRALELKNERVLITTFTNENLWQIERRICDLAGVVPGNITLMGWFSFLLREMAKPYQRAVLGSSRQIEGLNFKGSRSRYATKGTHQYYLDSRSHIYRDGVSELATQINDATKGAPISRLERAWRHVFIDEVQDLAGYDLEVLDALFRSSMEVTCVGDPRQATLRTNLGQKNKKYLGPAQVNWFKEREGLVEIEEVTSCFRSNQTICDFADSLFPDMPRTQSMFNETSGHDGIFLVLAKDVPSYYARWNPEILRWDRRTNTHGLPATNIGVSKGSTYARSLIFPTKPMVTFLENRDPDKLKAREKFYVAATRSRFSTAFVVEKSDGIDLPVFEPE